MAAPATTARVAPAGKFLQDGYSTKIAFARDSNVSFWEKTVKPPGVSGGDKINISTMHNTAWRTFAGRNLKEMTDVTVVAAYDPVVFSVADVRDTLVNQEGAITVHFPDASTLDFFGYLVEIEPSEHSEGEQPEVTLTIVVTNFDPTNRVEAPPVLTEVSGT